MLLYALTTVVSAFLLFQVQPIIAKIILPWFGGSAAVWTVCLLFFQMVLLLGYLYAHTVVRYLKPRAQMMLHGGRPDGGDTGAAGGYGGTAVFHALNDGTAAAGLVRAEV